VPTQVNPIQPTSADLEPPTYNEQLNAVDRYWKFKMALAIALILSGIIGIGCIGWAVSTAKNLPSDYAYGYDSTWSLPWGLITFSISVVWCFLCILLFVIRKRPVHPGVRVTMDLLLWLGFLTTALFTMYALIDLLQWGEYGTLDYGSFYSSYGDYVLQRNNTWVWESNSENSGITYPRSCNSSSSSSSYSYYYDTPPFANCAEMDAYVNALWHAKPNRARVELTGTVCQFLGLVLHFALFVWACVDTHKHRRTKVSKDAEILAAGIVEKMVQNGTVIPSSGQAHNRAPGWQGAYQNLPSGPNSFSGQGQGQGRPYPVPGQHPTYVQQIAALQMGTHKHMSGEGPLPPLPPRPQPPQQAQAGPSNEKAKGVASSYYEPQR
jgi:hypothetical protein